MDCEWWGQYDNLDHTQHMNNFITPNIDYNEISFIEQALKRSIEYYNDLNIKKPDDKLYKDALKTVTSLHKKIKELRISKGEKHSIQIVVPQKNSKQLKFNFDG